MASIWNCNRLPSAAVKTSTRKLAVSKASSRLSVGTPYTLVVTPSAGFNCHLLGNPPASGIAPRHNLSFNVDCSTPPRGRPARSTSMATDGSTRPMHALSQRGCSACAAHRFTPLQQPSNGRDANALDQFIGAQVAVQNYDLDADGVTNPPPMV